MKHIYVLCFCLIYTAGCKKDATPVSPELITGKRDYVWMRDTIQYLGNAQTTMQSMYGTSGNNVFVVGHCEVSGGRMYHYDGTRWQPVNLAVGRGTWHYNGIGWRRFDELGDAMGYDCFSDGKETFIVGNDNFRTCLIQGK